MKTLFKIAFIFLAITGASSLLIQYTNVDFGKTNFFEIHGWFFLICISFFPRLTLLFSSVAFGGFFWWVGFIFTPRFLVAILATIAYWNTNPILVTISWLVAISGETSEKYALSRKGLFSFGKPAVYFKFKSQHEQREKNGNSDVFEAEYKIKD